MQAAQDIVSESVAKYPDDIDKACKSAESRIRRLPEFEEYREHLVHMAVQELVYRARCDMNMQIKRANGHYGGAAKVVVGESANVNAVAQSWFDYSIGNKTLGSLLGEELSAIAEAEGERALGHTFNKMLMDRLAPLVPKDKTVRQAVKRQQLDKIAANIQKVLKRGGRAA